MNEKVSFVRIAEAKGGAPFWRHYVRMGVGKCQVGCLFCYNNRWAWSKQDWRSFLIDKGTEDQFAAFRWTSGKCKQYEGPYDIMMCSVGDPFADENQENTLTVLDLARRSEVGDHLRVLSKLDGYPLMYGDGKDREISRNTMFGSTIVTLDEKIQKQTMPNAAAVEDILGGYLYAASSNGNPTFISCEPMLTGMNLCDLAELLNEHEIETIEEIWVGHLNYGFGCEDLAMSDEEILEQVQYLTDSYNFKVYLKREVKGSEDFREAGVVAKEGYIYDP